MSAQATIAAKTAVTAIALTGTALSINPRGRDQKGVLSWVAPGSTNLDDISVDFSYQASNLSGSATKAKLRAFSPKTHLDANSVVVRDGVNAATIDFSFVSNATAVERQKLVDVLTSALTDEAVRTALVNGDVMY